MYICICNAIRESELRRFAQRTQGDAESVYAMMGKRPNCGTCLMQADEILAEEREMSVESALAG